MITKYGYFKLKERYKNGFRWIARDKDGCLYMYYSEPKRLVYSWDTERGCSEWSLNDDSLPFIKWEDEEPTRIDDLIRDYEANQVITGGTNVNKAELIKEIEDILEDSGVRDYQLGERNEYGRWSIPSSIIRKILSAIEKCSIEKEKQYILKFSNGQYLYSCDLGTTDEALGCKLTKAEIEAVDPRLMEFAEEVD